MENLYLHEYRSSETRVRVCFALDVITRTLR